jgi:hypothetical protein
MTRISLFNTHPIDLRTWSTDTRNLSLLAGLNKDCSHRTSHEEDITPPFSTHVLFFDKALPWRIILLLPLFNFCLYWTSPGDVGEGDGFGDEIFGEKETQAVMIVCMQHG